MDKKWALVNLEDVSYFPTLKMLETHRSHRAGFRKLHNTYKKVGRDKWLLHTKRVDDDYYLNIVTMATGRHVFLHEDIPQEGDIVARSGMV